jgi:hypothetical protein
VVTNGELFHCTVAPERKPDPLTVRVSAGPPAVAEGGERLVTMGGGGTTLRVSGCVAVLLAESTTSTLKL